MRKFSHRLVTAPCVVVALAVAPACSLKTMAVKTVANTLAEPGDVFTRDNDPELVRDALPFGLLRLEGAVRLYAMELRPGFRLYVSAVNLSAASPPQVLTSPENWVETLYAALGPFYTVGMPEETGALRDGEKRYLRGNEGLHLRDASGLAQCRQDIRVGRETNPRRGRREPRDCRGPHVGERERQIDRDPLLREPHETITEGLPAVVLEIARRFTGLRR